MSIRLDKRGIGFDDFIELGIAVLVFAIILAIVVIVGQSEKTAIANDALLKEERIAANENLLSYLNVQNADGKRNLDVIAETALKDADSQRTEETTLKIQQTIEDIIKPSLSAFFDPIYTKTAGE